MKTYKTLADARAENPEQFDKAIYDAVLYAVNKVGKDAAIKAISKDYRKESNVNSI